VTYLVDSLRRGRIHRPQGVLALPGGKSLNVARALAVLGARVEAITPLGGHTGRRVRAALAPSGVRLTAVPVRAETRTCVSIVDEQSGQTTEVYEESTPVEPDEWSALAEAIRATSAGWLVVSGSVPAAVAPMLGEILAERAAAGVNVAIDTHGEPLRTLLRIFTPAAVKVNRAEAAELVGDGRTPQLCARLRERGVRTAIVTDGARGSVLGTTEGMALVTGPGGGHYTVGAGDCYLAGFLAALVTGSRPVEAAIAATATAVANTYVPGAARFEPADVAAAVRRVTVEPLD